MTGFDLLSCIRLGSGLADFVERELAARCNREMSAGMATSAMCIVLLCDRGDDACTPPVGVVLCRTRPCLVFVLFDRTCLILLTAGVAISGVPTAAEICAIDGVLLDLV